MGKSTISMAIFNSYVKLPEGTCYHSPSISPQTIGTEAADGHFPGGRAVSVGGSGRAGAGAWQGPRAARWVTLKNSPWIWATYSDLIDYTSNIPIRS